MSGSVSVTFLGGLGDIGRNCAVIEIEGRLIVLDCGQLFGDDLTPGVDTILPDLSYITDRSDRVDAVIATHAHEDHIGALPFLMKNLDCPIYGSPFTMGMVDNKLGMAGIRGTELRTIHDGETHHIGPVDCEFIPVTHSTPSGLITAFHTPQGVILHSCDFKLDLTPVDGRLTDLSRIGALGNDPGVRLLLCDSTNADSPGVSTSESTIGGVLQGVLDKRPDQRIIVAAFSSHIHRVQQVADAAVAQGRKVATLGRSMQRNTSLAKDLGLLKIPDGHLIDIDDIGDYEAGKVCIVCTGSQGEERSALATMASGDNRWVSINEDDCVVFSSHPIPGNEAAVARLRNDLTRRGAEVVHSGHVEVHTSGHGKAHELRTLHSVASPEFFVPVHGEYY
ncbi:MAG: ribonuclease J, partial [Acidobacteria bacterium]|nr:ribonuclease J [Acidobacteriota bacterium]